MRNRKSVIMLCALLIGGLTLAAQEASISGPLSGFVFDRASRSIRPIVGLPGAAYLGDAVAAGLDWAAVAPEGAVALAARDGRLWAVRGVGAEQTWVAVEGVVATPDRAAWNADGSLAVVYAREEGRVQFLRNLADDPVAGPAVELPGRISALALESASGCAVAGVEAPRDGGLYLVCPEAPVRQLAAMAEPAAIALAGGGRDLFVAERATGRILEIRDFRDEAAVMVFAASPGEGWDPVGLAVSADQRRLFVADRAGQRVDAYEVATRTLLAQIAVDGEPSLLEPLSVKSVFLLRSAGGGGEPLLVLDAGREPAVYFVPAGRGE